MNIVIVTYINSSLQHHFVMLKATVFNMLCVVYVVRDVWRPDSVSHSHGVSVQHRGDLGARGAAKRVHPVVADAADDARAD